MRLHGLAGFVLVAALGGAGAATPSCEHVYRSGPGLPTTCLTAVAAGWYLTPGISRRKPDGVSSPVSSTDLAVFKAGTAEAAAISLSGDARYPAARFDRRDEWAPEASFTYYGGLERRFALQAWRGKRVSLTLRLRDGEDATAYVSVQINKKNYDAIRTAARMNRPGGAWQSHTFVLDVPDNATTLIVDAGLTGKGAIWLDGGTLQAADHTVAVSWSERISGPQAGSPHVLNGKGEIFPTPGPGRPEED